MAAPQMSSRASSITAYDIPFGTQTPKNADIFQNTKENDTGDRFGSQQQKNVGTKHGRVIGGTYAVEYEERCSDDMKLGLLERIEGCNLPLTLTKFEYIDNKEYIVLMFADGDKENPYNWSSGRKRFISSLLCMMTLFIGLATTAYSSGINSMVQDLGTSTELGQMGLFCFNMACALAPLFLAPFCELVGRRIVYVGAYALFCVCFVGLALGKNIASILIMRTLLGLFGCVGTILVGGTFSDIYTPNQRARPMACFSFVAILGTVGAPVYANYINMTIGWRWIEGVQGLSNVPLLIVIILGLRETRGGVTLHKRAEALRKVTGDERYMAGMDLEAKNIKEMLHNSSIKAVKMLITEPVVLAFGMWIAFAWFVTFLFLSVIPITFVEKRNFNEGEGGLPYISLCIGVTLAFALNFFQIKKYERIMNGPESMVVPESRLYGAIYCSWMLPVGLFTYSFTQYGYLPWIAPTIALAPIAFGIFFIFEATYSFTSDCYGDSASSAIAGQGLMRNTLGAVAPLFASQFFHGIGSQYAGLILSVAATMLTLVPLVMFKYGKILRSRSKLAKTQKGYKAQDDKTGLYT